MADHSSSTSQPNKKCIKPKKNQVGNKRKSDSEPVSSHKRPRRATRKPDRLGKRVSTINRNEFFEQFSNDASINSENTVDNSHHSDDSTISSDSLHNKTTADDSHQSNSSSLTRPVQSEQSDSERNLHEASDNLEQSSSQWSSDHGTKNFETTVVRKLDEILKRISYIEKDNCKTQARLAKLERNFERYLERLNGNGIDVMEAVCDTDRERLGIPISSKIALDKFEVDLASSDFKSESVIFV